MLGFADEMTNAANEGKVFESVANEVESLSFCEEELTFKRKNRDTAL